MVIKLANLEKGPLSKQYTKTDAERITSEEYAEKKDVQGPTRPYQALIEANKLALEQVRFPSYLIKNK